MLQFNEDKKAIHDRIIKDIKSVSKGDGTFIQEATTPVAAELEVSYNKLENLNERVFVSSAYENGHSEDLEKRVNEFGVFKKQGKKATGYINIKGNNDIKLPKGSIVETKGKLQYETLEDGIIKNNISIVPIRALKPGSEFNIEPGLIIGSIIKYVGITSITNKTPISGGIDVETDKQLYERFLNKVSNPATSGNVNQYKQWALEVDGVGGAEVIECAYGPGTVKVVISSNDKRKPSNEVIDNVFNHIESLRPICVDIRVVSIEEFMINISVKVEFDSNVTLEDVKKDIRNNVEKYLKNNVDSVIRYSKLESSISNTPGVIDHSDLTINNDTKNIQLNKDVVPVLGEVVIND